MRFTTTCIDAQSLARRQATSCSVGRSRASVARTLPTAFEVPRPLCTCGKRKATTYRDRLSRLCTDPTGVSRTAPKTTFLLLAPLLLRPRISTMLTLPALRPRERRPPLPPLLSLRAGPQWDVWSMTPTPVPSTAVRPSRATTPSSPASPAARRAASLMRVWSMAQSAGAATRPTSMLPQRASAMSDVPAISGPSAVADTGSTSTAPRMPSPPPPPRHPLPPPRRSPLRRCRLAGPHWDVMSTMAQTER